MTAPDFGVPSFIGLNPQREGFYESMHEHMRMQLANLSRLVSELRAEAKTERERTSRAEEERDAFKSLAMQYGTMTDVEKRAERGMLYGRVAISRDVALYAKDDAIAFACMDLAKKMRHSPSPQRET